jgi:hypothetical protein
VIPGSAADQGSGLQPGDTIVAVNGVHISEWDEEKLLEAFRGEDIIGSKCRLTIERPDAKHLGPVDVEVLRTNASFAKEVELLFLLGQEHASLLQGQAASEALNASLQAIMHQAVALERHRILHEQILGSRLRGLQIRILESVTEAEKQLKAGSGTSDPAASQQLQDLEERFLNVAELLEILKGPPGVTPAEMASAIKGANMSGQDVITLLETARAGGPNAEHITELEERFLYVSDLLALLQGPPLVEPSKLAGAAREAGVNAAELLEILNAMSRKKKSAAEVIGLINGDRGKNDGHDEELAGLKASLAAKEDQMATKDAEIAELQTKINAALQPKACTECALKDSEIEALKKQLADQQTPMVRVERPKVSRSAAPPSVRASPPPGPPGPPSFLPAPGTFEKQISATINSNERDARVYYTTDGSAPSEANYKQTGMAPLTIEVKESTLIKAIVVSDGRVGQVGEVKYDIPVLAGKSPDTVQKLPFCSLLEPRAVSSSPSCLCA